MLWWVVGVVALIALLRWAIQRGGHPCKQGQIIQMKAHGSF
jgi:hypothetical protein